MTTQTNLVLYISAVGALSPAVFAEQPAQQETMQVTASRQAQTVDEAMATATIINRDDIELSLAQDLFDLLRLQAGIDIVRAGGQGQQTSLFMRGTNSNQVLVLIDGVRVASAHTGSFSWEHLPLTQIERIEIVRGPRASFYGSDAIGGVIQIFTGRGKGARAHISGGSYSSYETSAGWGAGERGGSHFGLHAARRDNAGFSAQNRNGFSFNPDKDGYRNSSVSMNAGMATSQTSKISANLLFSNATTEFDQGISENSSLTFGSQWRQNGAAYNQSISFGYQDDTLETPAFFSRFDNRRTGLDWQGNWDTRNQGLLSLGASYYNESGKSGSYNQDRDNAAAFAGWQSGPGQHSFQFSGRFDDNSEFGSKATGQAAWKWALNDQFQVTSSLGSGFRAPNMGEQFSPGFGGLFAGNPDLEPEESNSLEFSASWSTTAQSSIRASLFDTKIDNLIAFTGGETFRATNVKRAQITGLELEYSYADGPWQINANATFQNPRDRSSDTQLLRRPKQKFNLRINRDWNARWQSGLEFIHGGESNDFGAVLAGYELLNLSTRMTINKQWQISLRLDNLFNTQYELARGFNTPGRSGFIGIDWGN